MEILSNWFLNKFERFKNDFYSLYITQVPRLIYNNGVLSEESILFILKTLKSNLKFEIFEETAKFIKERRNVHYDKEMYYKIIDKHIEKIEEIEKNCIFDTLATFGLNSKQFELSLDFCKSSEKIAEAFRKIQTCKIPRAKEAKNGMSLILLIAYLKMMDECANNDPCESLYKKYEALDEIYGTNFEFDELDFEFAKKLFKNQLSTINISEVKIRIKKLNENVLDK